MKKIIFSIFLFVFSICVNADEHLSVTKKYSVKIYSINKRRRREI